MSHKQYKNDGVLIWMSEGSLKHTKHLFKEGWLNEDGLHKIYCPRCNAYNEGARLEPLFSTVGIYQGSGLICRKCECNIYAIDRRNDPIVIQCGNSTQPLNTELYERYQRNESLCPE